MVNADSAFFGGFNAALPDMTNNFGEMWNLPRTSGDYQAIAMDKELLGSQVMSGGKQITASALLFVSDAVMLASGVVKGDLIIARGDRFNVRSIEKDGDASKTLVLDSAGIDVWR